MTFPWPLLFAVLMCSVIYFYAGAAALAAEAYQDSVTVKIQRVKPQPDQLCRNLISDLMTPVLFEEAAPQTIPAGLPDDVSGYLGNQYGQLKLSTTNAACLSMDSKNMAGVNLRTISRDDIFPLLLLAGQNGARSTGLPFLQRLEIEGSINDGYASGSVTTLQPLWHDDAERHHVFSQLSWFRTSDDDYADTISAGIAYRHLNQNETWLLGANLFLDHAYKRNHNRMSLGLDARTSLVAIAINRYLPLSGWKNADAVTQERATGGWDFEVRGQTPHLPSWTGTIKAYTWDDQGDEVRIYGAEAGIEYSPFDLLTVRVGLRDESHNDPSLQLGLRFNWRFDENRAAQLRPRLQLASVKERVYDKTQRENRTRISRRSVGTPAAIPAPSGYSVAFTTDPLTPANHTAAAFTLTGAEIGATYTYVISSSGGGVTVTGNGTVASATQNFTGIDVSAMQDGTLTVSMTLTNSSGLAGAAATDTVTKNARFICGTAAEGGTITLTAPAGQVFTAVEFASYGTPNGACGSYTLGACHAANSSALTAAAFIGNNSGSITGSNGVFGDPCNGTLKRMFVQLRY